VILAAGVVAGYFLHKHQDQIILALSKASGMGKDFLLQQKESLADLVERPRKRKASRPAPVNRNSLPLRSRPVLLNGNVKETHE